MKGKIEALIKEVYKSWQSAQPEQGGSHPDEEALASLAEGRLSRGEADVLKGHLINCRHCSEALALSLEAQGGFEQVELPQEVLTYIKELLPARQNRSLLEIILRFKDKAIEILRTSGDVLLGQEVVAASLLRARKLNDFQDEVIIFKDFEELRVEIRIENKSRGSFDLNISVKDKQSQDAIKDLRITLIRDDLELESYLSGTGAVTFEHILLGRYKVEISSIESKLATVLLDIKS